MEFSKIMAQKNENENNILTCSIALCIGYSGNHQIKELGLKYLKTDQSVRNIHSKHEN